MSDAVVGVDIGTGAARALALGGDGRVLGVATVRYRGAESWPAGRAVAAAWRDACLEALQALAVTTPAAARPVAVAVGGQSPTTVAQGSPLAVTIAHPAGNDLDNAARQQAQRALLEDERRDGGEPVVPRQLWDWLLHELGGEDVQGRWPEDPTLEGFGEPRRTGEVIGEAAGSEGLPAGTPLVTGAQDAFLAFWAGGIDSAGRAMDPGGRTGGLAVATARGAVPRDLWSFPSAARGVDIVGGPVNAHGLSFDWVSRLTGVPHETLLRDAERVAPGAGGLLFLPYLEGERAPRWESRLRGVVAGLDGEVTAAELCRAVLEGTAYGLAHVAQRIREAGTAIDVLVCAGTPARSALWCGIKAAVLGVDVEVPDDPDLAAYGAALAAGAGAGWWPRPGDGAPGDWPRPPMRRLAPISEASAYGGGLARFVAAGDLAQHHLAIFGTNTERRHTAMRS